MASVLKNLIGEDDTNNVQQFAKKQIDRKWYNFHALSPTISILPGTLSMNDKYFKFASRGKQAAACSIISIVFSQMFEPKVWTSNHVDEIINSGDKLYRLSHTHNQVNKNEYTTPIMVYPEFFIEDYKCSVRMESSNIHGNIFNERGDWPDLTDSLQRFFKLNNWGVITAQGSSVAIWRHSKYGFFYFDPSYCNEKGVRATSNGVACVMRFKCMDDMRELFVKSVNEKFDTRYTINKVILTSVNLFDRGTVMVNKFKVDNSIVKSLNRVKMVENNLSCTKVISNVAKMATTVKKITTEPLTITTSNYNIDTKFAMMPLVDQNNFNTGYPYYDLEINIPSVFQELADNRAILHGWTHESSDVYKGKGRQNIANCIMSIAMKKVYPVKTWIRPRLDEILRLGDALYAELNIAKPTIKSMNTADFNDTKIIIEEKKYYVCVDLLTIIGTFSSNLSVVLNIQQALEKFFLINKDGIIECSSMAIAVWTHHNYFYMFDPRECDAEGVRVIEEKVKARRKIKKYDLNESKRKSDGKCCVMRVSSIDSLATQFLKNVDPSKKNDRFIIRRIKIIKDIPGTRPWCNFQPGERGKTWVLSGTSSDNSDELKDNSRGIQGITVPVVALIKAKEIPPNEWTKETVDDVIRESDEYYNWCISSEDVNKYELSLQNLKKNLYIKNRRVKINIQESSIIGDVKATSHTQLPNLSKGIVQFFNIHQFGIVELEGLTVAIWKFSEKEQTIHSVQETSYYYYDSIPQGKIDHGDIKGDKVSSACVIRTLDPVELSRYIEMNIDHKVADEFVIHSVKVESISDPMTDQKIVIDKQISIKRDLNAYVEMGDDGAYLNGTFDQSNVIQFKPQTCNKQQAANALVTLAMSQLYNPHLWYDKVIDDILKLGDEITQENLNNLPEQVEYAEKGGKTIIIERLRNYLLPNEIDETFNIGTNRVTVLIEEAIKMKPVGNLADTLYEFFAENPMGILQQENVILPIWREGNIYFTMNPRGRSHSESMEQEGIATVFWYVSLLSFASNIQHLLINPNGNITIEIVQLENEYETRLAENKRPKKTMSTEILWYNFPKKTNGIWELVGDVSMNDEQFSIENRGKQSAAVSIMAVIFSKVHEPRQWTKEIIDKVVITGDKLHDNSVVRLGESISPRVNQILNEFFLSNRRLNLMIKDSVEIGKITEPSSRIQDLKSGLENFFQDDNSGIITLANELNISIWPSQNHYYCFIPDTSSLDGDQAKVIKPRVLRCASIEHIANELGAFVNADADYEMHEIDILDWDELQTWKFDPSPAIRPSNLPPLNAYKQLQGGARAILRAGINQGSHIFLETIKNRQSAANCVVALGMFVIKNPVTWTKKTLDDILVIGCNVHCESLKVLPKKLKLMPPDVIRIFRIGVNVLTADVDESTVTGSVTMPPPKPQVEDKKKARVKQSTRNKEKMKKRRREPSPPPPSPILLKEGLEKFFESNNAGILVAGRFMIAIWKNNGIYFMYDPHARNDQGVAEEDGVACTIWFACLQPFYELIFNNIHEMDKFGSYVICRTVVRTTIIEALPFPVGFQPFFEIIGTSTAENSIGKNITIGVESLSEYYHVDEELSTLQGTLHMRDACFDVTTRGFQSTAIAAVAIVVGVLHVPATWGAQLINSILKYGDILHGESMRKSNSGARILSPTELLTVFVVGDFKTTIYIHRYTTVGILLVHDLVQGLTLFFQNNCAGILHTQNLAVAVMQHYGKYYLFDPCECDKFGNPSHGGAACVVKCDNIMRLASLFVNNCNYKIPCVYTINTVNVLNLQFFSDITSEYTPQLTKMKLSY